MVMFCFFWWISQSSGHYNCHYNGRYNELANRAGNLVHFVAPLRKKTEHHHDSLFLCPFRRSAEKQPEQNLKNNLFLWRTPNKKWTKVVVSTKKTEHHQRRFSFFGAERRNGQVERGCTVHQKTKLYHGDVQSLH